MSFGFPLGWAWLFAGIVVIALYFLRRRERDVPVSALFLWERVPPDRTSRLERLRKHFDLLLLVQLVAVIFFAFSISHPTIVRPRSAGAMAILIDGSASMAVEGRKESAIARAQEIIRDSSGPWTVIVWANPPKFLVPPTEKKEEAKALVGQFQPTLGSRPPLGKALALLTSPWDRIVVITDDPPEEGGLEVVLLPPVENLAITAFAVRPHPDGSGYEALVRVRNGTPRFQDVRITLRAGPSAYFQSRLLPPMSEDTFVFPYFGPLTPWFRAELSPTDPFPWDNVRYFALTGQSAIRVRWLGEDDRYVWAALSAAGPFVRTQEPPWDISLGVRTELRALPSGPLLLVEASSPEVQLSQPVAAGPFFAAPNDPLAQHISPGSFVAKEVRPVTLPDGAEVALWSGEFPAVVRWERALGRRVLLTVNLSSSNLPLTPDFAILIRNALSWLLPYQLKPAYVVGEPVVLGEGMVATPDGPVSGIWLPQHPGLFEVKKDGRMEVIAVNVPWEESHWRQDNFVYSEQPKAIITDSPTLWPIWTYTLAAALVALLGELALAWRRLFWGG